MSKYTTQPLPQLPEWCLSGNINYPVDPAWDDYDGMLHATALKMEEDVQLQQGIPILDEYCWMHEGPGNGGWCCRQCCRQCWNEVSA